MFLKGSRCRNDAIVIILARAPKRGEEDGGPVEEIWSSVERIPKDRAKMLGCAPNTNTNLNTNPNPNPNSYTVHVGYFIFVRPTTQLCQ
jgi:hypothetical protein